MDFQSSSLSPEDGQYSHNAADAMEGTEVSRTLILLSCASSAFLVVPGAQKGDVRHCKAPLRNFAG